MSLFDGLVAGYKQDGDALDFSGNGRDATPIGSTFTSPGKVFAQAALYDGDNDRWDLPATGIDTDTKTFSCGGWVNFANAIGNSEAIMGCGSFNIAFAQKFAMLLRREVNGTLLFGLGRSQVYLATLTSTDTILSNPDTDFHVFGTYDGSKTFAGLKFYFNGSLITDFSEVSSFGASPLAYDDWLLGSDANIDQDMAGKQNQMLLYDKVVSASEISDLWNDGAGFDFDVAAGNINRKLGRGLNRGLGRGL